MFSAEDVLRDLAEQLRPFGIDEGSVPRDEAGLLTDEAGASPDAARVTAAPAARADGAKECAAPNVPHAAPVPVPQPAMNEGERAAAEHAAAAGAADGGENGEAGLLGYLRKHGPTHADILAAAAGLSAASANAALVGLEMLGKVRRLPGARYEVLP